MTARFLPGVRTRSSQAALSTAGPWVLLLLFPTVALAAGSEGRVQAVRVSTPPSLDGRLDEEPWKSAPLFDGFVQTFPEEGQVPSERTELRVLYDDQNLYVGVICFDSRPEAIDRQLGRRDSPPQSDLVSISIDSSLDRRTAYSFEVTAGGVLRDALLFDDVKSSTEWDALWDAAVAERPDGWSLEMIIPLHVLRFSPKPEHIWGLGVRRQIARTREVVDSTLIPREANGKVSRFGQLRGLSALAPPRAIELSPYVAARLSLRPQASDAVPPAARLLGPSGDVGADLRASLSSGVTLNATVNPDFGQVEADQLIFNLSTFEQFFPEKRPFFTQGMEAFQPVVAPGGSASQMLFYSRRIGLETPILTAAKLTGRIGDNVQVGLLDAVVMGSEAPAQDRSLQFHPRRPFHFGLDDELPVEAGLPRNFLAAIVRGPVTAGATLGATYAGSIPLASGCGSGAPLGEDGACLLSGGHAAAVDWNLRTDDGTWVVLGQVAGSRVVGPAEARQLLRDGTELRSGDMGLGATVTGGKLGGEPLRFELGYEYASPRLELNATGFLRTHNEQLAWGSTSYVRPSGWGPLLDFSATLSGSRRWSTDARGLPLQDEVSLQVSALLPGFHQAVCATSAQVSRLDLREIASTGIAYERPGVGIISCSFTTNENLSGFLDLQGYVGKTFASGLGEQRGGGLGVTGTWRPTTRLETQLGGSVQTNIDGPRWLRLLEEDRHLFGELVPYALSVTLRQLLVLTPRLTLQAYGQLFTTYGRYGPFYEASAAPGSTLRIEALRPSASDEPLDYKQALLNLNVVLRWEYRLGSTLFVVYSRSQSARPAAEGTAVVTDLWPRGLLSGLATDTLLLKWSHHFAL